MTDTIPQAGANASGELDFDAEPSAVERWLAPVSESDRCGQDLAMQDPLYFELNEAAEDIPESPTSRARPPDWSEVQRLSEELLDKTRDLHVAILWLRANVHRRQYAGLADGLRLITGLLENFWDGLHPAPAEGEDAIARRNAMLGFNKPMIVLRDVGDAAIINAGRADAITVRMILAAGQQEGGGPNLQQLESAIAAALVADPELGPLGARTVHWVRRLQAVLTERFGLGKEPELAELSTMLDSVDAAFGAAARLAASQASVQAGAGSAATRPKETRTEGVNSRNDAIRYIDEVCKFLDRSEPSNPAQFLLRRAQGMLDRNFLDLMKDIAPNAFADVAKLMGVDPNKFDSSKR